MVRPETKSAGATSPAAGAKPRHLLVRLGVALALSAAAALMTSLLRPALSNINFIFFFPALLAAAWFGGFWAGALVAVAAIITVDLVFVSPAGTLSWPNLQELASFVLFLLIGGVVAALVRRSHIAQLAALRGEAEAQKLAARLGEQTESLELQAADLEEQTVELEQAMDEAEVAREQAQQALADSEAERRRVSILAETSRALAESQDYGERLQALGTLVVRELADFCLIDVIEEDGGVKRVVARARDPELQPLAERSRSYVPAPSTLEGPGRVMRTGEPDVRLDVEAEQLARFAVSSDHHDLIRAMQPRSVIVMPLSTSKRMHGAITLIRSTTLPRFEPADVELARVMATRASLLLELARVYREAMQEIERRREVEQQLSEKAEQLEQLNVEQEEIMAQLEQRTQQAEAAERLAVEASQAKSQFLAVMSHELRTPLNAIMGYSDLLQSGAAGVELNDVGRSFLDRIRISVLHLRGLIDEVLSLSRIEAGKEELVAERVNLAAVLREVATMVQTDALRKGLRVAVEIEDDVIATTDAGKLRQILINLASNAVKFTDTGSVRLTLRSRRAAADIEVIDSGVGIPAEHLERIFEPFTQVDQSRTRRAGGTGLGLPVSRKLARLLGGDIHVHSQPGQGSRFMLSLPLELVNAHDADRPDAHSATR